MRILSPLVLWNMAMYPFIISAIYKYAFPSEIYVGSKSTMLLTLISLLLALIGVVTIFLPLRKKKYDQNEKYKWPSFIGGVVLIFVAFFGAILFWYSPTFEIFGFKEPAPLAGVASFLILSSLSVFVLYSSSQKGSEKRPNLMRILVILASYLASIVTLALALILLYAFPSSTTGSVAYPTAATTCFMSYIIWGGLIFQVNREKAK